MNPFVFIIVGLITGGKGERLPSENELAAARFQGKHVATLASRLAKVPE